MSDRVIIFDTTLRDGEQSPGATMDLSEKIRIARQLEMLGVDVIEAGFPAASDGDFEAVKAIAQNVENAQVAGLARANAKDIDRAWEAVKFARNPRIHTFIATSPIHMEYKLRKTPDEVVDLAVAAVKRAASYTPNVEFSAEDASRSDRDFLVRIVTAAIDAGATTINIPDTVGYTVPEEFGGIITTLFNRVPNIDRAIISVHCHNDLGMATANSITAIQHGARQIECCMNGLGERAGNCSLEEVAMAIKLREKSLGGLYTGINPKQIARTSGLVSKICSEPVPAHKAIVGSNAFAHSSGIHQDGVLKNRETYEILTPESVGFTGNTMRMTARSGRHMIRASLANMGYKDDEYDLNEIYARFLKLADKKGQVFDYDLEALLFCSTLEEEENTFELDALSVMTGGSHSIPTASVRLRVGKRTRSDSSIGNGPVDAVYNCITRLTGIRCELTSFTIALGQVDVNVRHEGRIFHGIGMSVDILEAAALALIHASNNIDRANRIRETRRHEKDADVPQHLP